MGEQDGGPAFPGECGNSPNDSRRGMSLREWFAGQAIAGWCHSGKVHLDEDGPCGTSVRWAYNMADAMLAARSTPNAGEGELVKVCRERIIPLLEKTAHPFNHEHTALNELRAALSAAAKAGGGE